MSLCRGLFLVFLLSVICLIVFSELCKEQKNNKGKSVKEGESWVFGCSMYLWLVIAGVFTAFSGMGWVYALLGGC